MFILGISSATTQEEVNRALSRADQEMATLQQLRQRTAAQENRLKALKEAMAAFMEQYVGNTTTTDPNPPDYSIEGDGRTVSNPPASTATNNSSNAAPDPAADQNTGTNTTSQQTQGDERERLYCKWCKYSSVHVGHYNNHVNAHRRG